MHRAVKQYVVSGGLVLFASVSPAIGYAQSCDGHAATIVGTRGNDILHGTNGVDVIVAGRGDDTIYGYNGNDIICGNRGRDLIYGGKGADRIYGNNGADTIYGARGTDYIHGGNGADSLYGGKHNDSINGAGGVDFINGGKGTDTCENESADTVTLCENQPNSGALAQIDALQYTGAFRLPSSTFGSSSLHDATGVLAYNPDRNSLFVAGNFVQNSVAEFPIVTAGMQSNLSALPSTGAPLQNFVNLLSSVSNPNGLNRVTGMYWLNGSLIVNGEDFYDAENSDTDTTLVVANANNLAGAISGYYKQQGRAHSAGYMGPIPVEWQSAFGAEHYTGWSTVWSIINRYSVGPSLWTFNADALIAGNTGTSVSTQPFLDYPHSPTSQQLSPNGIDWAPQGTPGPFPLADPLWNGLSAGRYGFFIPDTSTFAVIGSTAGLQSGIGYKAIQSDGNECPGPCPYEPDDVTNYYWFYDVSEILSASNAYEPKPYAYGPFNVPFDQGGENRIIGATFAASTKTLFVAVEHAGYDPGINPYEYPPLIATFSVN